LDLCLLPKEAYLLVQIYTSTLNAATNSAMDKSFQAVYFQEVFSKTVVNNEPIEMVSSSVNRLRNNLVDKCLAWASRALFKDNL
jgi:hypothetical protein